MAAYVTAAWRLLLAEDYMSARAAAEMPAHGLAERSSFGLDGPGSAVPGGGEGAGGDGATEEEEEEEEELKGMADDSGEEASEDSALIGGGAGVPSSSSSSALRSPSSPSSSSSARPARVVVPNPFPLAPAVHAAVVLLLWPFTGAAGTALVAVCVAALHGYLYTMAGLAGVGWDPHLAGASAAGGAAVFGVAAVARSQWLSGGAGDDVDVSGIGSFSWWVFALLLAAAAAGAGLEGARRAEAKAYAQRDEVPPNRALGYPFQRVGALYADMLGAPPLPRRR